jgi:hypothetical protein
MGVVFDLMVLHHATAHSGHVLMGYHDVDGREFDNLLVFHRGTTPMTLR